MLDSKSPTLDLGADANGWTPYLATSWLQLRTSGSPFSRSDEKSPSRSLVHLPYQSAFPFQMSAALERVEYLGGESVFRAPPAKERVFELFSRRPA